MAKSSIHAYSRYSVDALELMGNLIRESRMAANLTAEALAQRAGISRSLLHRIEKGEPGCTIGAVFEVAAIVGIKLFDMDANNLATRLGHSTEKRALLPKAVRFSKRVVKDDF